MRQIHISLDDVKGIFKALIKGVPDSIFDTRTLGFLRYMHESYNVCFDLFCTFKCENYSLSEMPGKYKYEFEKNADWLRFGFHCYEETDNYSLVNEEQFRYCFTEFSNEIKRVTGQNNYLKMLRLHGFSGSADVCKVLKESGVDILLTSDDNRCDYYLSSEENRKLHTNLQYFDDSLGIQFYKSCTRLEHSDKTDIDVENYKRLNVDVIPFFTHEWLMDDPKIRERVEKVCRLRDEYEKSICNNSCL